jgi:VWFA-related protein
MMGSSVAALLGLAMLLPAALAAPAAPAGAAAPATPSDTFAESVDVSVVNVEVYVDDRDGKRVHGLKREDFELTEDGRPIPISNFYAVDGEAPAGTAGSIPDEQRLYLAIFFDERSLTVSARNRMIPVLKRFVAGRLRPGDRLLLVSYNGSVKVLQGATTEPAAIDAALGKLAKGSAKGTELMIDHRRILSDISSAASPGIPDPRSILGDVASQTYQDIQIFAQQAHDEIRATLGALGEFAGSLSGLPGRKAVLLVSGGMAQRPGEDLYEAWRIKFQRFSRQAGASGFDSFRQDTTRLFGELVDHANANRVTFYTLALPQDVSGSSAEFAGDGLGSQAIGAIAAINETQPLQTLAGATGGLAAIDKTTQFLERLRADLETYYSLGYVPTHPPDGKKHRLAVKVRDRGLSVRSREAYQARTGPEVTSSRTLSALLLGEGGNPFGISLAVTGETRNRKGQYEVVLLVKLPMSKVLLVPRGGTHEGRVRVFVGARDTQGRLSAINEILVPIHVPEAQLASLEGKDVGTRVTLLMRSGPHTVAVGVRDEIANTDSTVTATYTAGQPAKPGGRPGGGSPGGGR